MKRFVLLIAALATLLIGAISTVAPTHTVAAPAFTNGESRVPHELCLAVLGQDVEKNLCSDGSGGATGGGT